jgi:hypothetical protein
MESKNGTQDVMTFEQFAERLAARSQHRLAFDEVAKLAKDRWSDIGEVPRMGNATVAMERVASALGTCRDTFHFGRLTVYAGYLAEQGAPTRTVALLIAERLAWYLSFAAVAVERTGNQRDLMQVATDISESNPSAASAILIIDAAVPGAMSVLARERAALRAARKIPDLVANAKTVAEFAKIAYFLVSLLESSDEQPAVILLPTRRKGFEIVADYVRNGFHLFALLEGALLGRFLEGPEVPLEEIAIARGEQSLEGKREFRARFDYFNWSAWNTGAFVADAPARWIWGELPLGAIPQVRGNVVILMETAQYKRTFDGSLIARVHPDVRSAVEVTGTLSASDVAQWLDLLATAPQVARDNMKYAGVKLD